MDVTFLAASGTFYTFSNTLLLNVIHCFALCKLRNAGFYKSVACTGGLNW